MTADEIVEENNYYPFGLQQKGYNAAITGRSHNLKYNNTELEEGLGLDWYEMPLRSYDPTIARWNRIDPVVHHGLSTYNSFDNNPIFYSDPSGGNSEDESTEGAVSQPLSDREISQQENDIVINWNMIPQHGGASWFSRADHSFSYDHNFAMVMFGGANEREGLEAVGLTYVDYGNGYGASTRGTVNSALRQITNNIQNGYVQEGYRQGQMTYASGLAGDSGWRYVPGIGSGAASIDWFARGDVSRGLLYAGLAISDVIAIKALATAGGRLLLKAAANSIDNVSAITLSRAEMSVIYGAGDDASIQTLISSIAKEHSQLFKCKDCASSIVSALKQRGIKGQIIDLQTPYSNIWNAQLGKNISTNGTHRAVQVNGMVYDNIYTNGIKYNDWIKQFDAPFGALKVTKTGF
ncbi:papain fold toxin domain-containing protein [Aquimarina pacifica]|uniref:papain fold toxin domain-containing protein n=1 Tax=Aquimarina pacifica TaxID=1296415 RepID=UPI00047180A7|nr:papain fold toxin domain-containing protein [Aquimarina pacifica]